MQCSLRFELAGPLPRELLTAGPGISHKKQHVDHLSALRRIDPQLTRHKAINEHCISTHTTTPTYHRTHVRVYQKWLQLQGFLGD